MKKDYLTVRDLPTFTENPFVVKAIEKIESHKVYKKRFLKGSKGIEQTIISSDGEIVGHTAFLQHIEVDEDKFTKLYLSQLSAFFDLPKPAIRVFCYIMSDCLIPNQDAFYFDIHEAVKYTGYSSQKYINSGIASLVNAGIIAKNKNYKYFINPMVAFNGDRVSFARTYVRKKTKSIKDDPNQLKLFPTDGDFEQEQQK